MHLTYSVDSGLAFTQIFAHPHTLCRWPTFFRKSESILGSEICSDIEDQRMSLGKMELLVKTIKFVWYFFGCLWNSKVWHFCSIIGRYECFLAIKRFSVVRDILQVTPDVFPKKMLKFCLWMRRDPMKFRNKIPPPQKKKKSENPKVDIIAW